MSEAEPERYVGEEARKTYRLKLENGFIDRYLSGANILDIGYRGYIADVVPIVPQAIGIELDYPGYDGRTLPFADGSQDAVFASHCLEHIPDFRNALQDWFRVLRVGGHLVIMVPHQYLYEKRVALPSRYNADHQRFYTPASLMVDIETSLTPNTYRLRHLADNDLHFDYAIPPDRHSGGCYELEVVVEKIAAPDWVLDAGGDVSQPARPDIGVHSPGLSTDDVEEAPQRDTALLAAPAGVSIADFGRDPDRIRRILVLKLDHLGDFIIGLPALRLLRQSFPDAHITLIVGSWNRQAATTSGLIDEVATYDYFPENARAWDGRPVQALEIFKAAAQGVFDVAIDLRADEDTRHLLSHVTATMRCGIGAHLRMPYLHVVLPLDGTQRSVNTAERLEHGLLGPERFHSRMPKRNAFHHETDFSVGDRHVIYGPYIALPYGRFRVTFGLQVAGLRFSVPKTRITLDVARGGAEVVAQRVLTLGQIADGDTVSLEFMNEDDSRYEFRVHTAGRPLRTTLRFLGVHLEHLDGVATARFRRADLHVGEQLSLLVQLVTERTRQLYPVPPPSPIPAGCTASASAEGQHAALLQGLPQARYRIVIAPVSNSDLRDWPMEHYIELVRLLLERVDCIVLLIGVRAQSGQLAHIAQRSGAAARIANLAGRLDWTALPGFLQLADLVICNNSGVGHLAASVGAPTLAIYSASHQPQEWGPRGPRSKAVMAVVPCSPCGYDRLVECPHDHACMQGLSPDIIFAQALLLLGGD